jgi:hypothetical protein
MAYRATPDRPSQPYTELKTVLLPFTDGMM